VSGQVLSPAATASLETLFSPVNSGTKNATLLIPSDDPASPLAVALNGLATTVLWSDDFEDGSATDWLHKKGTWTVVNGDLIGIYNRKADNVAPFSGCSVCEIEGDMRVETVGARASLLAWYQDKRTLVELQMAEDKDRWLVKQKINGITVAKGKAAQSINPNIDYHVRIAYDGTAFQTYVNDVLILTIPSGGAANGTVGFRLKSTTGVFATAGFREILVY
jgi:hypothetical protein